MNELALFAGSGTAWSENSRRSWSSSGCKNIHGTSTTSKMPMKPIPTLRHYQTDLEQNLLQSIEDGHRVVVPLEGFNAQFRWYIIGN